MKIKSLTKVNKRARRLAAAAGLSKATWGQAYLGLAPSMLEKLRADMAGATGINQAGRCKTTAIAVAYGSHKHDPAVKLAKDTVLSWMQLWKGTSGGQTAGGHGESSTATSFKTARSSGERSQDRSAPA